MFWLLAGLYALLLFVYITNLAQLIHKTPNPSWFERIGKG